MLNNGKIIKSPLMLRDYTIYNQVSLLCDLHKKNKTLVCFQAIWKPLIYAFFLSSS